MSITRWWPYAISALSGIAAAFAFMPYGWSHVASGAITAGIGAMLPTAVISGRVARNASDKPKVP